MQIGCEALGVVSGAMSLAGILMAGGNRLQQNGTKGVGSKAVPLPNRPPQHS